MQEPKVSEKSMPDAMSTERCAKLMVVGMANNLDEVWISENPPLLMLYINQYLPNLYRWYVLLNVCFYEETITFILLLFTRPNTKSAFSQHAFCRLQIDSSLRARSRWSTSAPGAKSSGEPLRRIVLPFARACDSKVSLPAG